MSFPHERDRRVVICGLDDSAAARRALAVAARLASRVRGRLVATHASSVRLRQPHGIGRHPERFRADAIATGHDLVNRVVAEVACRPPDRVLVEQGDPAAVLLRVAAEESAYLAVVGSGGRPGTGGATLGSVSASLAATSPCPVAVVRADDDKDVLSAPVSDPVTTIVCGVDDSPGSEAAARTAGALARGLGAKLLLAHVCRPALTKEGVRAARHAPGKLDYDRLLDREQRRGLRLVHRMLRHAAAAPAAELRLGVGAPSRALEEIAAVAFADLLVVGSRGRGARGSGLLGSTSMSLAATARRPVVVVPPTALAAVG
jgi:nucleotide-binding universal stress UspA family protein